LSDRESSCIDLRLEHSVVGTGVQGWEPCNGSHSYPRRAVGELRGVDSAHHSRDVVLVGLAMLYPPYIVGIAT